MWELFEQRLEAEHYLGPAVRAQALIERLIALPGETIDETVRAELDPLTFIDLRAFYNRTVELTGGPTGQAEGTADSKRWLPHRDRLLALRAVSGALLNEAAKTRTDQAIARDLDAAAAWMAIDERIERAILAAIARQASDEDATLLAAAVRDYQVIADRAPLSEGGLRLLNGKIGLALDSLGRACVARNRDAEARVHFRAATQMYLKAGDEHLAAASASMGEAAGQRVTPDADTQLEQLLAELRTAPEPSIERAAVLVRLAGLAQGNSDDFEARRWLDESIAELASAGCGIPGDEGTDQAVEEWIKAVPAGSAEDPNHFLRQVAAMLTLHSQLAGLRMAVPPPGAKPEEAAAIEAIAQDQLNRLAEIVMEIPAHSKAVQSRLEARLQLPPQSDPGAEYLAVMRIINELLDLTEQSAVDAPETAARWRQMADECVARARALGLPVTLAQALEAGARVKMATGEPEAAIGLLEESYEQACQVGGKLATDQAMIAMTDLAKVRLGLGLDHVAEASDAAGKVIDLIERDRYRISAPFQQAALLTTHADVFAIGVFSAWKSGAYDTMLRRMELSKARASVRQLFLTRTPRATEIDQELSALNDEIHALEPDFGPGDSDAEQERKLLRARQAQQPLRQQRLLLWDRRAISLRDPEAAVPAVTLAGIQELLEPDEAVIYYYWLRPLTLLVVTITADAFAAETKPVSQEQRTLLETMIRELGSLKGSNLNLEASYFAPLAPVLTPVEGLPLLEGKQRLIVSPHRLLHWYPFAAMPYQGRPLVRSFAIRYAPNLTSLLVPRPDPGEPRMAALAVSEFPGRPGLGDLHGVKREAEDITAIYAATGIPAVLTAEPGRAKVLAALRDGMLGGARCLLVATHGHSLMDEVSKDAPLESVLELAKGSVDGYEIAASDLHCEIVVLTACYAGQRAISGRGMAEQPGDELFGLSAAFLEARCGSVLAPTWPTEDPVMARLMPEFHRCLAEGFPADIALAQAQRRFLDTANAKERRAYYWAPLMLTAVGRPTAMASPIARPA